MSDVAAELAALRELITEARSMPMSASAVINRQQVLDAIARVETAYDEASSQSRAVVEERASVVAEGEQIAIETVRQAELRRDELVSDTEVFRVATREADSLRVEARQEADALRAETDAYIEQRLANFEHALDRTLAEVRRGIAHLSTKGRTEDPADVLLSGPDAG